LINFINFKPH